VLCEKPMTMTVEEGEDIVRTAAATGKICAVNYCYTGYPMVRHMKAMVARGASSAGSAWSRPNSAMATTPMQRMPTIRGCAGATIRPRRASRRRFADCGIHALHMASFVTGEEVEKLSADFVSCIAGRELEDDAMVNFRMAGAEPSGRLWTSSVAIGRQHGLAAGVWRKGGCAGPRNSPTSSTGCRSANGCR
jgi:predicted dehydrogenase